MFQIRRIPSPRRLEDRHRPGLGQQVATWHSQNMHFMIVTLLVSQFWQDFD
jgi:hypothetical protein